MRRAKNRKKPSYSSVSSNLGREFKNEEQPENWLDVSESLTAIEMMLRKYKK